MRNVSWTVGAKNGLFGGVRVAGGWVALVNPDKQGWISIWSKSLFLNQVDWAFKTEKWHLALHLNGHGFPSLWLLLSFFLLQGLSPPRTLWTWCSSRVSTVRQYLLATSTSRLSCSSRYLPLCQTRSALPPLWTSIPALPLPWLWRPKYQTRGCSSSSHSSTTVKLLQVSSSLSPNPNALSPSSHQPSSTTHWWCCFKRDSVSSSSLL